MDDWLKALLGIGGVVGGGLLSAEEYERLGDIGEQSLAGVTLEDGTKVPGALGLAQDALSMSQFRPFTVTSTMPGSGFKATPTVDPATGPITGTAATTSFGLGQDIMNRLRTNDMASRESAIYDRIRATQTPEEERQRLELEERLASQGRLGVRTSMFGGTREGMEMEKAQAEARNTAMIQAMQQAQAEQPQEAAQAQAFTGMGSQLAQTDLAQRAAQQNLSMASLGGSYVPQTQLMQLQSAMQPYQTQAQAGQLFGAGQYGETMMSGLEARLIAEQKAAGLLGGLGTGLLGALLS